MSFKDALKVAPEAGADHGQIVKAWNRQICVQRRKSAEASKTGDNKRVRLRRNPFQGPNWLLDVCFDARGTKPKYTLTPAGKEVNSEIIQWAVLKDQRSRLNLSKNFEKNKWRGLFQNESRKCRRWGQESSRGEFFLKFSRSPSTPPHLNLTLTGFSSASGGKKRLWVCGQRNAAHISATAAVEVMRSRVGACRAACASLSLY